MIDTDTGGLQPASKLLLRSGAGERPEQLAAQEFPVGGSFPSFPGQAAGAFAGAYPARRKYDGGRGCSPLCRNGITGSAITPLAAVVVTGADQLRIARALIVFQLALDGGKLAAGQTEFFGLSAQIGGNDEMDMRVITVQVHGGIGHRTGGAPLQVAGGEVAEDRRRGRRDVISVEGNDLLIQDITVPAPGQMAGVLEEYFDRGVEVMATRRREVVEERLPYSPPVVSKIVKELGKSWILAAVGLNDHARRAGRG